MTNVNELALRAKHSSEIMQRLKQQYQPLIAARVMLHMGFWRPEYMEAGQEAVEEAVMSYREEKGGFTTHLRQVLKNRLIDLRRREKVDKVAPISSLSEEQRTQVIGAQSVSAWQEEQEISRRREEIELFKGELEQMGLTLREIADASPKHAATRRLCRRACRHMLMQPALLEKARMGRVPVKELSGLLEVGPKALERHRKYLVACAVALGGEYHCIMEYILSREGEA